MIVHMHSCLMVNYFMHQVQTSAYQHSLLITGHLTPTAYVLICLSMKSGKARHVTARMHHVTNKGHHVTIYWVT